ncbi:MAG TPA: O-antigen ligase family protein [Polyangia bacterium]|nr:O-antigen ligase family protein [Polyangia bacterium]
MTSSSSTNASSEAAAPAAPTPQGHGSSRRGRARRSRLGANLSRAGVGLCIAVIVAAPLAAGGVHRPTLLWLQAGTLVCLLLFATGIGMQRRDARISAAVLLPLLFLLLPLLQSIPIPFGLRRLLDPNGTNLLADNALVPPTAWPLSLDPPATRAYIGTAAAALVAFVVAVHLASGQSRRYLLIRVVGLTGIAAVVVGISHRIARATEIYGSLRAGGHSLLMGPFVNPNHTAEFLEIAAFACLAAAFQRPTAMNRVGWGLGMVFCAAGAAATLSRGAIVALGTAMLLFVGLRILASRGESPGRQRSTLALGALLLGVVVLAAVAFGSAQVVERFSSESLGENTRLQLWRDSWRVLHAHPLGIGRGTFDRVYPVYRTLHTATTMRFAFVENEPLQWLIDGGWVFLAAVAAGFGVLAWHVARRGRRDAAESALIAGLVAVLVHSGLDFGLETPGVVLPFVVVLGTLLGRMRTPPPQNAKFKWPIAALAGASLVVGMASVAHGSYDDFDRLLKRAARPEVTRDLVLRAQRVHPTDYFYALTYARSEPIKSPMGGPSPRFHALNRALALCPSCDVTHVEVARNLWSLGLRRQALLEWRTAVDIQPRLLAPALGELFAAGAKPEQLASIAAMNSDRMIEVANFLASVSRLDQAVRVLDQAEAAGVSPREVLITRARFALKAGDDPVAASALAKARAQGIRDPRLAVVEAELGLHAKGDEHAADQALAVLDAAATQYPGDLEVARKRMDVVLTYRKWHAAPRAIEGLKLALFQTQGAISEAHVAAARVATQLSRWNQALGEYRIALAQQSWNVSLWMEYGRVAEAAGRPTAAREAYAEASRISPKNPEVMEAIRILEERMNRFRGAASGAARTP